MFLLKIVRPVVASLSLLASFLSSYSVLRASPNEIQVFHWDQLPELAIENILERLDDRELFLCKVLKKDQSIRQNLLSKRSLSGKKTFTSRNTLKIADSYRDIGCVFSLFGPEGSFSKIKKIELIGSNFFFEWIPSLPDSLEELVLGEKSIHCTTFAAMGEVALANTFKKLKAPRLSCQLNYN